MMIPARETKKLPNAVSPTFTALGETTFNNPIAAGATPHALRDAFNPLS